MSTFDLLSEHLRQAREASSIHDVPLYVCDAEPREEAIPVKVEEPDWRDHAWDARKSINAAERCDRHRDRSRNLLAAREQIDAALLLLLGPSL